MDEVVLFSFRTKASFEYEEVLESYLRPKAPKTVYRYRNLIRKLEQFTNGNILKTTSQQACMFATHWLSQDGMRSRIDSKNTRVSRITVVSGIKILSKLFCYFRKYELVTSDPFDAAVDLLGSARAGEKRPTEGIEPSKIRDLLTCHLLQTRDGLRDAAFIHVLLGGGLRISEALGLRTCDILSVNDKLFVRLLHQKNGHNNALQEIGPDQIPVILKYRDTREAEGGRGERPFLVFYKRGQPCCNHICNGSGEYMFRRICRAVGLPDSTTPHSCRAAGVTTLIIAGVPKKEIMIWSRHSTEQMVDVYDKRILKGDLVTSKLHF